MEDEPITKGEIQSEITGLNKGEKEAKKKQLMIGLIVGAGILLIAIIIIIIIVANSKDEIQAEPKTIGEINCLYDIQKTKTVLFGEQFLKGNSAFDIFIDGKKKKYTREYEFSNYGEHTIQIRIYSQYFLLT